MASTSGASVRMVSMRSSRRPGLIGELLTQERFNTVGVDVGELYTRSIAKTPGRRFELRPHDQPSAEHVLALSRQHYSDLVVRTDHRGAQDLCAETRDVNEPRRAP